VHVAHGGFDSYAYPYWRYKGTSHPAERLFHTTKPAKPDNAKITGTKKAQTTTGTICGAYGRRKLMLAANVE
jgi:hypothetical protein